MFQKVVDFVELMVVKIKNRLGLYPKYTAEDFNHTCIHTGFAVARMCNDCAKFNGVK